MSLSLTFFSITQTAYFVIPDDGIQHGKELICSYNGCSNPRTKFCYCVHCNQPVAKRNFARKHNHFCSAGDEISNSKSNIYTSRCNVGRISNIGSSNGSSCDESQNNTLSYRQSKTQGRRKSQLSDLETPCNDHVTRGESIIPATLDTLTNISSTSSTNMPNNNSDSLLTFRGSTPTCSEVPTTHTNTHTNTRQDNSNNNNNGIHKSFGTDTDSKQKLWGDLLLKRPAPAPRSLSNKDDTNKYNHSNSAMINSLQEVLREGEAIEKGDDNVNATLAVIDYVTDSANNNNTSRSRLEASDSRGEEKKKTKRGRTTSLSSTAATKKSITTKVSIMLSKNNNNNNVGEKEKVFTYKEEEFPYDDASTTSSSEISIELRPTGKKRKY